MTEFKLPAPVAWRNPSESYSIISAHQKETNEFQYSEAFLAGHTEPIYTHDQLIQTLTDLGDTIAYNLGNANNNYEFVIKRYIRGLLP